MTQSLQASAATILTTRSGGEIRYQAIDIGIVDAIHAFVVFLIALWRGGVVSASGDAARTIIDASSTPKRPHGKAATRRAIFAVWAWQYLRGWR
jgi:hypothetical protein